MNRIKTENLYRAKNAEIRVIFKEIYSGSGKNGSDFLITNSIENFRSHAETRRKLPKQISHK